jgi:t-SNARE complex subunit (syntaxin)
LKYKWDCCQNCGEHLGIAGLYIELLSGDAHNCKNIKNPKIHKIKKIVCYSIMISIYTFGAIVLIIKILALVGI